MHVRLLVFVKLIPTPMETSALKLSVGPSGLLLLIWLTVFPLSIYSVDRLRRTRSSAD
jgi:hypothetical protein